MKELWETEKIPGEAKGEIKWERIINCIKKAAEKTGMKKTHRVVGNGINGRAKEIKEDQTVKDQRRKIWIKLEKYIKSKQEVDKDELKMERRRLKEMIKTKRKEEKEEKWKEVRESKDMKSFWKSIGNFRTKRRAKGKCIDLGKWKAHFINLLEGEEIEEGDQRNLELAETDKEIITVEDKAQDDESERMSAAVEEENEENDDLNAEITMDLAT